MFQVFRAPHPCRPITTVGIANPIDAEMVCIEQLQRLSGIAEFAGPWSESGRVGKPLLEDFEMARDDQETLRGNGDLWEGVRDATAEFTFARIVVISANDSGGSSTYSSVAVSSASV